MIIAGCEEEGKQRGSILIGEDDSIDFHLESASCVLYARDQNVEYF